MNLSFLFPHGRDRITETEVCLIIMVIAYGVMLWNHVNLQKDVIKNHNHIRNIAAAVVEISQPNRKLVPRGIWL